VAGTAGRAERRPEADWGDQGAKVIDVKSMGGAKGDVTFCLGKDTSGDKTAAIKAFNAANPGINTKMIEFSTSADEQRAQFVQRQEAKSGERDLFHADVIWTAEFASQKWIYDMSAYVQEPKADLIPATPDTVTYEGKT
jgi:multiple sugar transport system substrate-binding protein